MTEGYKSAGFELVVQIRDLQGNPTGRTKTIRSDDASELESFLYKNTGKARKKGGRNQKRKAKKPETRQNKLVLKIQEFSNLQKDWDSYGAVAPMDEICQLAKNIANALSEEAVDKTQVVPTAKGGVQFELQNNTKSLEICLETPAMLTCYKTDNDSEIEEKDLSIDDVVGLKKMVDWLCRK